MVYNENLKKRRESDMSNSTNYLKEITIRGYKSIKECTIKMEKINVLVGANGSGKSNFIYALCTINSALNTESHVDFCTDDRNLLFYNETDNIFLKYKFKKCTYSITFNYDSSSQNIHKTNFMSGTGLLDKDREWTLYNFFKAKELISNNQGGIDDQILSADGANLASYLRRLKHNHNKEYKEIVSIIKLADPSFEDFVLENDNDKKTIPLNWRQKNKETIFNINQLSDGLVNFICLTTLLKSPKEILFPKIVIENPELYICPKNITLVAELIKELPKETQIVITTQSSELLDMFDIKNIISVKKDENGSTFKKPDTDQLSFWTDEGYTLGELWAKNLLYL